MMEALWAYRDESLYHIRGGELVLRAAQGLGLELVSKPRRRRGASRDIPASCSTPARKLPTRRPVAEGGVATKALYAIVGVHDKRR